MKPLNGAHTADRLIQFVRSSFTQTEFTRAVIAISGGVDSATSLALAVRAIGASNIYPLLLPCGRLNTQDVLDAMSLIEHLQIPVRNITRVDIKPVVDQLTRTESGMDNIRRGNIMARTRMIVAYDQAKKREALVVGTENKTEHLLGYYTRFGDEASDIEPLRNLYKTQVYELARFLSIPESILEKAPSAGLWPGQTDEGEFGFTYKDADEILSALVDEKKTIDQVVESGFDRSVVEKVYNRMQSNEFKHHLPFLP